MKAGENMARDLKKGSIVAIEGPLGAGKTVFVKGIARGLGIEEQVTSPTYTIISEYSGILNGEKITIFHIDAYRLTGSEDFLAIGGEEIIFGNDISLIEWSEKISGVIPPTAIKVIIEIKRDNERLIRVDNGGNM